MATQRNAGDQQTIQSSGAPLRRGAASSMHDKMYSTPNLTLRGRYKEIEDSQNPTPSLDDVNVIRLDENALVFQTRPRESTVIGFVVFVMIGLLLCPILFLLSPRIVAPLIHGEWGAPLTEDVILVLIYLLGISWLALFVISRSLIQPAASPIICDRRARKIYGSFLGKFVVLDWEKVRKVIMVISGKWTVTHLLFFQPLDPSAWTGKGKTRGTAIEVSIDNPHGTYGCRSIAEFIRRYMDEDPEQPAGELPPVRIPSSEPTWIAKVLDRGPYKDFVVDFNPQYAERLHERAGKPEIPLGWNIVGALFFAPGMVIHLAQVHLRRQLIWPASTWPPIAPGPNVYRRETLSEAEIALRRVTVKFALRWMGIVIPAGCAIYGLVFWRILRAVLL